MVNTFSMLPPWRINQDFARLFESWSLAAIVKVKINIELIQVVFFVNLLIFDTSIILVLGRIIFDFVHGSKQSSPLRWQQLVSISTINLCDCVSMIDCHFKHRTRLRDQRYNRNRSRQQKEDLSFSRSGNSDIKCCPNLIFKISELFCFDSQNPGLGSNFVDPLSAGKLKKKQRKAAAALASAAAGGKGSAGKHGRKKGKPIILVPAGPQSTIGLYNIADFLVHATYDFSRTN